MQPERRCPNCNKPVIGKSTKKFCDQYCKSNYHYQKTKNETDSFYYEVNQQLKLNRKLLKQYNKAGKATVRAEILHKEGFNPNFFTHYWKNSKNDVYLFVFEYGFIRRREGQHLKYVLIQWQDYMVAGNKSR